MNHQINSPVYVFALKKISQPREMNVNGPTLNKCSENMSTCKPPHPMNHSNSPLIRNNFCPSSKPSLKFRQTPFTS